MLHCHSLHVEERKHGEKKSHSDQWFCQKHYINALSLNNEGEKREVWVFLLNKLSEEFIS